MTPTVHTSQAWERLTTTDRRTFLKLSGMSAAAFVVGSAPVVSAAPALGLAIGYDIDAALE
jgi:hypothetical protein